MKVSLSLIIVFALSISLAHGQQRVESEALVLPQIQVVPIEDTQANRQYELYVELPESYAENPDKRYPVLYYTDAVWHMEILSACAEYIMTQAILVGISWQTDIDEALKKEVGPHVSRYRDYSILPSSNSEYQTKYQFGQADKHLDFIRNDVISYVENHYRTDTDNRSYFGYSAGGLFGAYVLLSQPDTFKHYILGSPSMKGDIPALTKLYTQLDKQINTNVFISYGSQEEELGSYADQLIHLLEAKKRAGLTIEHSKPEGNHQTAFPSTGVQGVTWLAALLAPKDGD